MKLRTPNSVLALVAALAWLPVFAADLRVEVRGIAGTDGKIMIALFDNAQNYPNKMTSGLMLNAAAPVVTGVFTGLPKGEYAVQVYHDANGNGKLDTNLVGIPIERFGFSRDAAGSFGPPSFADAKVSVDSADQTIIINLR